MMTWEEQETGGVLMERRWRSWGVLFLPADDFAPSAREDSTPEQLNDVLYSQILCTRTIRNLTYVLEEQRVGEPDSYVPYP
jgi:hypothetical protein